MEISPFPVTDSGRLMLIYPRLATIKFDITKGPLPRAPATVTRLKTDLLNIGEELRVIRNRLQVRRNKARDQDSRVEIESSLQYAEEYGRMSRYLLMVLAAPRPPVVPPRVVPRPILGRKHEG